MRTGTMSDRFKLLKFYAIRMEVFFACVCVLLGLLQLVNYDYTVALKAFAYCFVFLQVPIILMCLRFNNSLKKDGIK
jgi:hypothetical protein